MGNLIARIIKKIQQLRTSKVIKKQRRNNEVIVDDNIKGNLKIDIQGANNVVRLTNISIPATKNRKIIYIYIYMAIIMKLLLIMFR